MTREQLQTAADRLATARESAGDDASARLADLSDQLETLADRETAPDHGRLARIQSALADLETSVDDETAATIDEADDAINAFRETIEGV